MDLSGSQQDSPVSPVSCTRPRTRVIRSLYPETQQIRDLNF